MKQGVLVVLLVGGGVGCITDTRASRDRGAAGFFENVPVYPAPKVSRCAKFKTGGAAGKACADALYLAEVYVRRLSSGDEVCLEGGFGERVVPGCLARATVADTDTNRLLVGALCPAGLEVVRQRGQPVLVRRGRAGRPLPGRPQLLTS
jgi:hypothetical protein